MGKCHVLPYLAGLKTTSFSDSDSDTCLLATLMEYNSLHRHIITLFYTLKIEVIYKNELILFSKMSDFIQMPFLPCLAGLNINSCLAKFQVLFRYIIISGLKLISHFGLSSKISTQALTWRNTVTYIMLKCWETKIRRYKQLFHKKYMENTGIYGYHYQFYHF